MQCFSISLINQKWFNQFQVFLSYMKLDFFKAILYFFGHTYFKVQFLQLTNR